LTQLKTAFLREGIDISQLPLTMDSAGRVPPACG
jgi:hypothetical protein